MNQKEKVHVTKQGLMIITTFVQVVNLKTGSYSVQNSFIPVAFVTDLSAVT